MEKSVPILNYLMYTLPTIYSLRIFTHYASTYIILRYILFLIHISSNFLMQMQ